MEFSSKEEQVTVDYIKLSKKESDEIGTVLLSIAEREEPGKIRKFLGYEEGFRPIKVSIESGVFVWTFETTMDN
jgi:hypothetical protein